MAFEGFGLADIAILLVIWTVVTIINQSIHYWQIIREANKIRSEVEQGRQELKDHSTNLMNTMNSDIDTRMTKWGKGTTEGILELQGNFQDQALRVIDGKLSQEPSIKALKNHGKELLAQNEQLDKMTAVINQAASDPDLANVMGGIQELREKEIIKPGTTSDQIAQAIEALAGAGRFSEIKESAIVLLNRFKGEQMQTTGDKQIQSYIVR